MTEYAGILVIFYAYCFSLLLSSWCSVFLKNYLHGAKSVCAFILEYIYFHSSFFLHYVIFPPLWWFLFSFDTAVAENNQYIIRQYRYGGRDYYEQKSIYKKSGILEKYVGLFDSSDSYSELNQLDYVIKEFKIDNMTFTGNVLLKRNENGQVVTKDTLIVYPIYEKEAPM